MIATVQVKRLSFIIYTIDQYFSIEWKRRILILFFTSFSSYTSSSSSFLLASVIDCHHQNFLLSEKFSDIHFLCRCCTMLNWYRIFVREKKRERERELKKKRERKEKKLLCSRLKFLWTRNNNFCFFPNIFDSCHGLNGICDNFIFLESKNERKKSSKKERKFDQKLNPYKKKIFLFRYIKAKIEKSAFGGHTTIT